jgi:uncharacterized protein YciI
MFVIELTYKAPLAKIDATMREHVAFLEKYYAAGNFLVSGRQIPRVGGIIVAVGESRKRIEAIMAEDPFCRDGLADAGDRVSRQPAGGRYREEAGPLLTHCGHPRRGGRV